MLKTVNAALGAQSRAIGIEVNTKAKTIKFGLQVSRSAVLKNGACACCCLRSGTQRRRLAKRWQR